MTLATSCPRCGTTFRVRSEQLAVRGGMVRCGVCKHVFRALDALRALEAGSQPPEAPTQPPEAPTQPSEALTQPPSEPAPPSAPAPSDSEFELSVPAFDDAASDPVVVAAAGRLLELDRGLPGEAPDPFARPLAPQARAVEEDFHSSMPFGPLPTPSGPGASATEPRESDLVAKLDADKRLPSGEPAQPAQADSMPGAWQAASDTTAVHAPAAAPVASPRGEPVTPAAEDALFASTHAARRSRAARFAGVAVATMLALAAALQGALLARDTLAARHPALAPALSSLAAAFGLQVGLPRRLSQLTIEGFDLRAVPGTTQLTMTAVLRNTSDLPLQWPAMEITLTDTAGEVVVRKGLLPADYLRGTPARVDAGIAAGTEVPLRVSMQGPEGGPTGYTVNLFYP